MALLILLASQSRAAPLSLSQAVLESLRNNFDVQISHLSTESSAASVTKAKGDFDLKLSLSYTDEDSDTPSSSSLDGVSGSLLTHDQTYAATLSKTFFWGSELSLPYSLVRSESNSSNSTSSLTYTSDIALSLTQPLIQTFAFGYTDRALRVAQWDELVSQEKHRQKMNDKAFAVIGLYLDLREEQRTVDIKKTALQAAQQTHEFARSKSALGKASSVDLAEAESQWRRSQEELLEAESRRDSKFEELAQEVFADSQRPVATTPLADLPEKPAPEDFAAHYEYALAHRSEVKSSASATQKAQLEKRNAMVDRLPTLDLDAEVSYAGLATTQSAANDQAFEREHRSTSTGLTLQYPLFTRAARGAYQIKSLQLQQEEVKRAQLNKTIALEITKSLRDLKVQSQRRQALQAVVRAESERYEGQSLRYQLGKISTHDLLQAQKDRESAELDLLEAEMALYKGYFALAKARGDLLEKVKFF